MWSEVIWEVTSGDLLLEMGIGVKDPKLLQNWWKLTTKRVLIFQNLKGMYPHHSWVFIHVSSHMKMVV